MSACYLLCGEEHPLSSWGAIEGALARHPSGQFEWRGKRRDTLHFQFAPIDFVVPADDIKFVETRTTESQPHGFAASEWQDQARAAVAVENLNTHMRRRIEPAVAVGGECTRAAVVGGIGHV